MTSGDVDLLAELEHYRTLAGQLQGALDSRVLIEQAKGVLAERYGWTADQAFETLRKWCRGNNIKMVDAAAMLVGKPSTDLR